ncbi:hypothetical protein Ccrd_026498 [Cynara cardunculus var. scolymus]|uniref:Uncharacterized protein n=1 Tax=Cynara cardunculus var. scolymus TaxID=59895 RepID=A0A103PCG0_CYNCS|nr:hypothetical protein Ccrd_026498 [Cynara cardunculus var. scolymus]
MDELDSIINSFILPGKVVLTYDDFQALHRSTDDLFFHLHDLRNQAIGDKDQDEERRVHARANGHHDYGIRVGVLSSY